MPQFSARRPRGSVTLLASCLSNRFVPSKGWGGWGFPKNREPETVRREGALGPEVPVQQAPLMPACSRPSWPHRCWVAVNEVFAAQPTPGARAHRWCPFLDILCLPGVYSLLGGLRETTGVQSVSVCVPQIPWCC